MLPRLPGPLPQSSRPLNLTLTLENPSKRFGLFGTADRNLRLIRDTFAVQVVSRDDTIRLTGATDAVQRAAAVIEQLQQHLRHADFVTTEDVLRAIERGVAGGKAKAQGALDVYSRHGAVQPKTEGQKKYLDAIAKNDLTFCLGPAGTGKTYLAVASAAAMLKAGQVKRIVLARPAVEAGERLGFLPGDLQQKVNPYLRPLFDALHDMMDAETVKRFMVNEVVEVVPLAFMRGRTLNESVIILDEAQNTTASQMLMFLTRLGNESKMIVTGDPTQIDLDDDVDSGLDDAVDRLEGLKGIAVVELKRSDIVRHKLVQSIVNAYGHQE